MRMIRDIVRETVCGNGKNDCAAITADPSCGVYNPCEICETAFYCPKYGVQLAWTRSKVMYLFEEDEVGE